jgi:transcriptional regulator with XRE-family HTH domain
METTINLASAIKFLRTKKGISARAVSIGAGLSPSYVGKVEAGVLNPSFDAFCAIAEVLAMTDAEILLLVHLHQGDR